MSEYFLYTGLYKLGLWLWPILRGNGEHGDAYYLTMGYVANLSEIFIFNMVLNMIYNAEMPFFEQYKV